MKRFLSFVLLVFVTINSYAQSDIFVPESRTCSAMDHLHNHMESNPDLLHHQQQKHQEMQDWIAANPNFNETRATYTMPIVFHVVYNTNAQNISDTYILAQLDQINDDFQAMNSDIGSVPSEFPVGNVDIEFCLATVDPNGNATSGITRTQTSTSSFGTNDAMKFTNSGGINAWNTNQYFNVWICPMGGGILGYGQFPASFASQPNTDGLVLGYYTVGSQAQPNPQGQQFGGGRTATHELGHCLGLFHIWGDDNGTCNGSDQVGDTPNQANASSGCPNYPTSSCSSNDMTMNYMDYSNDACLTAFTPGQATRIASAISTYQYLQNKIAASTQVCGAAVLTAGINGSSSGCAPYSASFSDNSFGGATSWSWSFPNGIPATFNGPNPPAITYANPGNYNVTLVVTNAEGSDTETIVVTAVDCSNINCNLVNNLNGGALVLLEDTDSQQGGYVAGHNGFTDSAKAEYFSNTGNATQLNGAEFNFGFASGTGSIEFVVWDDNNGTPGTELATQAVAVSSIIADVNANSNTAVDFGGIINLSGSYFVGFKLDYGSNTVGLRTNSNGETSPTTAYELWSNDNMWYPFYDGTNNTWGLQISMAIYPNACTQNVTGQAPTANFTTSVVNQGCETVQIQYTDNSSNNPTSWSWSFPGGDPEMSTDQNPVILYTSAGSFNATLTATNASGNNAATQNNVVVVPTAITPDATVSTTTVYLDQSGLVTFTDNTTGATSWIWDFGDSSPTASTQTASHTYTSEGIYTATLTVSDGFCTEVTSATITVEQSVGVEDIEGLSSMNIYPNPVSETFFIELVSNQALELQIEIFDTRGRKVVSAGTVNVMGNVTYPVDASELAAGTYFVRIISGSNTATSKVLKF